VRPVRLEIEGLTSFRDRVVLDFDGLDLFAITGPTGAGKSSLIDAMTLALYGQVPRVSDKYKQLISHGAERMSVCFEFRVGAETYRVARSIRTAGSPALRLERVTAEGAEPLADRDKEIGAHIERILGLDYDAFVRSVVLPQGQFDAFLKGKPEERRKILVALLNLKVYEDMHGIVNRRATDSRREAEFIAGQLGSYFAEATPERLAELRREQADAERCAERLEKAVAAVAQGMLHARQVREARRDLQRLEKESGAETARAEAANAALQKAAAHQAELDRRGHDLDARVKATGFDETKLLALAAVKPRVEQLHELQPRLLKLEKDHGTAARALAARRAELRKAEDAQPALEDSARLEGQALEEAREAREELRRSHAAHALREHLVKGAPCPVCEQAVRAVPGGKAPAALESADARVRSAEEAAREAEAAAQQAGRTLERLRADVAGQEKAVASADEQRAETLKSAEAARAALIDGGYTAADMGDTRRLLERVVAELDRLQKGKAERDRLESDRKRLEADRTRLEGDLASAREKARDALARLEDLHARQAEAAEVVEAARTVLLARAKKESWGAIDAPLLGRDELDVLEGHQATLQGELTRASNTIVRVRGEAERLEQDIERAAELAERKRNLDGEGALASQLAQHLQANQFIAYVQEEALRVLAADGSLHLLALSQGRYSLGYADQDFHVIDHWNADRQRSVKTLSGGETFLASLALALALAERLADLAAEGRAGDRLESLFLDEGFGTLDPETLDLVVQAIETLHGGNRLVGVVTHLTDLAERLPARVMVTGGHGVPATVSIAG
jgi:exonuclease SbcC